MAKKKTTAKAAEKKEEAIVEELVEEILDQDVDKGEPDDIEVLENNPTVRITAYCIIYLTYARLIHIYKPYIVEQGKTKRGYSFTVEGNIILFTDLIKTLETFGFEYEIDILDESDNTSDKDNIELE